MNITFDYVKQFFSTHSRKKDTHKYDYGHVLIIAGSFGMSGAGIMASSACMRSGAGLVSLAVPSGIAIPVMSNVLEEMVLSVPNLSKDHGYFDDLSFKFLKKFMKEKKISLIIIGPGLSKNIRTILFVKNFLKFILNFEIDIIIDADAINAISNKIENNGFDFEIEFFREVENKKANILITPHYKEFQRLLNIKNLDFIKKNSAFLCKNIALKNKIICILKNFNTIVSDGREIFINFLGNPGMATAGMGDVLVGVIAGIKASFCDISMVEAAKIGIFIHSFSGDISKEKVGEISLNAKDVIQNLPLAFEFFNKVEKKYIM